MSSPPVCSNCGFQYAAAQQPPCPNCGRSARTYSETLTATQKLLVSIRQVGKRASGFRFFEGKSGEKIAGKTGNLAEEALSIDRSDPSKTVKRHVVREQQPDGSWTVEHDETEEYPAKRRPE